MAGVVGFKTDIKDLAGRTSSFAKLGREIKRRLGTVGLMKADRILEDEAIEMRNTIIRSMQNSSKTGRRYPRGSKKGKMIYHIASSKGNPPRVDDGGLIASIGVDARRFEVEVGSRITDPAYPKFLEYGTDKMDARPWLEPAFDKHVGRIKTKLRWLLRRGMR